MNALVSVIMSTYNEDLDWIKDSVESILNQTYTNFEFIIILDKPENNILKELLYEYKGKDERVKIIVNKQNMGLAMSLNEGIKIAKGKYIVRMDADDISFPERIEKEVMYLEDNKLDMVSTNRIDMDEEGKFLPAKSSLPKTESVNKILPIGNFIAHPTVLIKTDVIKAVNGYRNFSTSQDYDLWLRILSSGYKIGILDEPLLYYRIRENSISKSDKYKQYLINKYQKELYKRRLKNGDDEFSIENMKKFLDKFNYYDDKNRNRFNHAHQVFSNGIVKIKRKQYIGGLLQILGSIIKHKEMGKYIRDIYIYKTMSKRWS